jgi:hypothetical protein
MSFFIKATLDEFKARINNKLKPRATPGNKNYFTINHQSMQLNDEQRKLFHTTTAKLLYLAKRARPDILTVTSFLCTRVKTPTEDDLHKLTHTLGYRIIH